MKRIIICMAGLSMLASAIAIVPAQAGAPRAPLIPQAGSALEVQPVQFTDRLERRGNRIYLNGQRGFREPRRGYRNYNGFWFPAAAFLGGMIIGDIFDGPRVIRPPYRRAVNAHVRWCYDRYRSYDSYSNTFQPYNGPRRQCYSPYG